MTRIHPTALVDRAAQLGAHVTVGPYSVVEADTVIGDGLAWADGDPLGERQTRAANRPTSVAVQVGRAMPPAPLHDPSITEGAG